MALLFKYFSSILVVVLLILEPVQSLQNYCLKDVSKLTITNTPYGCSCSENAFTYYKHLTDNAGFDFYVRIGRESTTVFYTPYVH
jgi:hypothetical protein